MRKDRMISHVTHAGQANVSTDVGGARWYACYTRARHEKRVDTLLKEKGFEAYLPLIPRRRQWHDRKKVVPWPLFPSYVFARVTRPALHRVLGTHGVSTVVRFDGEPVPIPDQEIDNVRRFAAAIAEAGVVPEPAPYCVREGQRARVITGPFQGVEGVVAEQRGQGRVLLVGLEAIGQAMNVVIDVRSLQVVS